MKKKSKIRVAVVMGGPSAERSISLASGKTMAQHLDPKRYDVLPFVVDQKQRWLAAPKFLTTGKVGTKALTPTPQADRPFDVALLAFHSYGEDGAVQGFLQ